MSRDVVITGVGAVTPLGVGARTLIERWSAGESGISDGVARCSDFDPTDFLSRREARRADRFTQMALVAADEALAQAGWSEAPPYDGDDVGCVIGTGIGGISTIEDQHTVMLERGPGAMSPLCVPQMMPNAAAGAVAMRHGLRGECYGTVSACAAEREAPILGRLTGYGATADAFHLTAPDPEGAGAARAMAAAMRDAGIEPGAVDYVNAHGTSTPLNDRSETEAIKRVFGDRATSVPVSSLKSSIGHLLGAAGAVEVVATLGALGDGVVPPTLNLEQPDEGLDLDYVPGESRPMERNGHPPIAISNSFGFGGHNVVLCMEAEES